MPLGLLSGKVPQQLQLCALCFDLNAFSHRGKVFQTQIDADALTQFWLLDRADEGRHAEPALARLAGHPFWLSVICKLANEAKL
jgi:hypothetical protein